jgi:hypothetical protein
MQFRLNPSVDHRYNKNPMGWLESFGILSFSKFKAPRYSLHQLTDDRGKVTNAINRMFQLDQYKL